MPVLVAFFATGRADRSSANACVRITLPTMKREYPDQPLVGVGAIIIEGDRVVLVKRGHPPLAGEWSIPGGVLEVGETLRQASVREAFEETGLTIEPGELLGVFDRIIRDDTGRTQYHYVLIDFLCRRVAGEPRAAGDAAEAKWFTKQEAAELPLAKDTADVIRLGFEQQNI
ncbi:MAG: NUDIX hydrolase [Terriglobales bacterium]